MQLSITFQESSSSQHAMILQRVLGKGKFTVYHAKGTNSNLNVALKVFPNSTASKLHFDREKSFLTKVQNHKNIINYLPITDCTLPYGVLATEFTPNGDFFDLITLYGLNDKMLVRTYFQQLIEGIQHLHKQNVAHCDLKLENLLLAKDFSLKIFDFDQAQNFGDFDLVSGGTVGYRAPELVNRTVTDMKALDIFAAGVILYTFMTGLMPFAEAKTSAASKSSRYATFVENKEKFWRAKTKETGLKFEDDFVELINSMLHPNPEERATIESIKRSRWYNKEVYANEDLVTIVKGKKSCPPAEL